MTFKHTLLALSLAFTLNQTVVATQQTGTTPNTPGVTITPANPVKGKNTTVTKVGQPEIILPHDRTVFESALAQAQTKGIQNFGAFIQELSKTYLVNLLEKPENKKLHDSMPTRNDVHLKGIARAIGKWIAEYNFDNILEGVNAAKAHIADKLSQTQTGEN